jgi:hypothetical protein
MFVRGCFAALLFASTGFSQHLEVSGARLRAHIKYLASDELEGRGVGTRGEKLATDYLASQLQAEGLKPAGDNGTFFQSVPMVAATTLPNATMTIVGPKKQTSLVFVKDYVGTAFSQQPENNFDAEAVLVGHGISAPEFGWDDYKGANLAGKVLIYFTNEPPSEDPKFFVGPALT